MFTYVFLFVIISLYREWEPIFIFVSWRIPRSHWHRESAFAVSLRLRNLLQKCQSQILRCHWTAIWSWVIIDTAESELFKRWSRFSRWIHSHIETALARESGPYTGELFDEKKQRVIIIYIILRFKFKFDLYKKPLF
jgi:hypothetical protein